MCTIKETCPFKEYLPQQIKRIKYIMIPIFPL